MESKRENIWSSSKSPLGDVEWVRAFFRDISFSPHSHDTYAIGYTTSGVQSFRYRGEAIHSQVGEAFILHPDEVHDGHPGTDQGYGYRIAYIAPNLISNALGGDPLPFVRNAVTSDPRMRGVVARLFDAQNDPKDGLLIADAVGDISNALQRLSDGKKRTAGTIDFVTMTQIREHLLDCLPGSISVSDLERDHGMDRFSISRQFRAAYGINPHRFVTLRRLDLVKRAILRGEPLADAAAIGGFSDQSHMTRQFRKAFGLSPGIWKRLSLGANSAH